jgi:hypothetical protein
LELSADSLTDRFLQLLEQDVRNNPWFPICTIGTQRLSSVSTESCDAGAGVDRIRCVVGCCEVRKYADRRAACATATSAAMAALTAIAAVTGIAAAKGPVAGAAIAPIASASTAAALAAVSSIARSPEKD